MSTPKLILLLLGLLLLIAAAVITTDIYSPRVRPHPSSSPATTTSFS